MNAKNTKKLITIIGPTACGKSSLAFELCRRFDGVIISADSRQVYQGMDIGTGKEAWGHTIEKHSGYWIVNGIKVYGYDIVHPDDDFSVSQYVDFVKQIVWPEIEKSNHQPFLVGGTGFYIKALLEGIATINIPPNPVLRQELEQLQKEQGVDALYQKLLSLWPEKAAIIDHHNPRRIIRALEIKAANKDVIPVIPSLPVESLSVGLNWERTKLHQRIDLRVDEMITHGLIDEITSLTETFSYDLPSLHTIGYQEFQSYLKKESTLEESIQTLKYHTHAYARRQLTWFNKQSNIHWYQLSDGNNRIPEIEESIGSFLNQGKE